MKKCNFDSFFKGALAPARIRICRAQQLAASLRHGHKKESLGHWDKESLTHYYGALAQLARALGWQPRGHEFESRRLHLNKWIVASMLKWKVLEQCKDSFRPFHWKGFFISGNFFSLSNRLSIVTAGVMSQCVLRIFNYLLQISRITGILSGCNYQGECIGKSIQLAHYISITKDLISRVLLDCSGRIAYKATQIVWTGRRNMSPPRQLCVMIKSSCADFYHYPEDVLCAVSACLPVIKLTIWINLITHLNPSWKYE